MFWISIAVGLIALILLLSILAHCISAGDVAEREKDKIILTRYIESNKDNPELIADKEIQKIINITEKMYQSIDKTFSATQKALDKALDEASKTPFNAWTVTKTKITTNTNPKPKPIPTSASTEEKSKEKTKKKPKWRSIDEPFEPQG